MYEVTSETTSEVALTTEEVVSTGAEIKTIERPLGNPLIFLDLKSFTVPKGQVSTISLVGALS